MLVSDPAKIRQMVKNVSADGVYDYDGHPAFVRVGRGTFEGTVRDSWIEVGSGGCIKVKLEHVQGRVDPDPYAEPARPVPSPSHPESPSSFLPAAELAAPQDMKHLPSGVITSFAILAPPIVHHPPPASRRWVKSPPNTVVSTFPKEDAIPQLECFLPSYPTFLSLTPPTVEDISMIVAPSNIIDFSTDGVSSLATFRWMTISCGEDKNFIQGLTTWEKVGKGGEEYGCGFYIPVTMCMVTSLPIVGSSRRCLVRLKNFLHKMPLDEIRWHIRSLALETPSPVAGLLNVQVGFIQGPSIAVEVPHPSGLPPLPHGGALQATLLLLGESNFKGILSAFLGEQKVLIVSTNECHRSMVCETLLALLFPLVWGWPCIPILPESMCEFIQAPVPFVLGVDRLTKDVRQHLVPEVIIYDIDKKAFVDGGGKPETLPPSLSKKLSEAFHDFFKSIEIPETTKINYTQKESRAELRFRVAHALILSSFIEEMSVILESVFDSPTYHFAVTFARTQMFAHFADRVENHFPFFHDLLDLSQITDEASRTVNAALVVLDEYAKNVEVYKVPKKGAQVTTVENADR